MKVWMRALYLAMALLMVLTAVPAAAAAGESNEEKAPEDFVILLDCSMSLGANDPKNLCLEACKNFVDKLPTQNARVSVIAFGYEAGNTFTYSAQFEVEYLQDAQLINVVVPFGDLSTTKAKEEYKEIVAHAINSNRKNTNTWTPIGHAMAAAVDLLEGNGAADGKACIILVSDGVREPRTLYQDERLLDPASKLAGQHKWPVYCIELNYNNNNDEQVQAAQALMDNLCRNSGDREVGRLSCKTPSDVHIAFQKIFHDFYQRPGSLDDLVKEVKLPCEYTFEIPHLTSEATVDIFGDSITSVELINMDQNTTTKISTGMETDNLIVVKEDNYYSIKMICPEAGNWKALINGDADATVLVSCIPITEMELTMKAIPSTDKAVLDKTDSVEILANFTYVLNNGKIFELLNSEFYVENPATVKIVCSNGKTMEQKMEATMGGYAYKLSAADVPTGSFQVYVELRHSMFRNGVQISNAATFKTQNLPLELVKKDSLSLDAFVNGNKERVDLNTIFSNPDKDPVTYTFGCTSDRGKEFDYTLDPTTGYLDIAPGVVPGTYALEVTAKDPDMKEPLVYNFELEVTNRAPVYSAEENPVAVEDLWLDNWPLQEVGAVETVVDLDDYFSDPDNLGLTYQVKAADGEEGPLVTVEQDGSKLTILPVLDGTATVTVVASDGLDEITASFDVTVLSASAVYWEANGFWWILGIIIFLVIVLTCITLFCTTKVRGKWSISVTVNGRTASCSPIALTTCGKACKKRKFTLLELIRGARKYLTTGDPTVAANITDYFTESNKADKITLHGVALGNGFKLSGVPKKNPNISVTHDGRPIIKGSIRSGNVQFTLRKTSNTGVSEAQILLNCATKAKKRH